MTLSLRHFITSILPRLAKWVGIAVGVVLVLLLAGTVLLNTQSVQNRIRQDATQMLSEKLNTRVAIDNVRFNIFGGDFSLGGVAIDDQQGAEMLRMENLAVQLAVLPLFHKQICISQVRVEGLTATLVGPPHQEQANYQFLIDSLTAKPKKKEREKLSIDIDDVALKNIQLNWNGNRVQLASLTYKKGLLGKPNAELEGLELNWKGHNKKGVMDCWVRVASMKLEESDDTYIMQIDTVRMKSDNHRPRKNAGKPKKGFFDVGHLDLTASLRLRANLTKDSIRAKVEDIRIEDKVTGIDVHDLNFTVSGNKRALKVEALSLMQGQTTIRFDSADIVLPDKSAGTPLQYATSEITGTVYLKDIARPFTQVLKTFTMPLNLSARMQGEGESMTFSGVHVWTSDRKFDVRAKGGIRHLRNKETRTVHFDINQMRTTGAKAMQIINQLAIKKFMMKQLEALGTITYQGRMDIPRKQEKFRGTVRTGVGAMDLDLNINGLTKYVSGRIRTDSVMLGQVINMPAIGALACTADFRFDISKERTAKMRRKVGGKLPMGEVHAQVPQASFKKIKVRNITADIESNGALAQGRVAITGGRADLLCSFSFTNTDSIHKMKIKPGVSFHKISEEKKQARAEKREKQVEKQNQKMNERKEKRKEKRLARKEKKKNKKEEE